MTRSLLALPPAIFEIRAESNTQRSAPVDAALDRRDYRPAAAFLTVADKKNMFITPLGWAEEATELTLYGNTYQLRKAWSWLWN